MSNRITNITEKKPCGCQDPISSSSDCGQEITDSLELARRINCSTDIVSGLTNIICHKLPKKSIQGPNKEATNTRILHAIKVVEKKIDEGGGGEEIEPIPEYQINELFDSDDDTPVIQDGRISDNTIDDLFPGM